MVLSEQELATSRETYVRRQFQDALIFDNPDIEGLPTELRSGRLSGDVIFGRQSWMWWAPKAARFMTGRFDEDPTRDELELETPDAALPYGSVAQRIWRNWLLRVGGSYEMTRKPREVLTECVEEWDGETDANTPHGAVARLMLAHDHAVASCFLGPEGRGPIVVWGRDGERVYSVPAARTNDADILGFQLSWAEIIPSLCHTWRRGGSRAAAARDFLCAWLEAVVAKVRADAEADFDRSVAVSQDGASIVCADRVYVLTDEGWIQYPAAAFAGNKIITQAGTFKERFGGPQDEEQYCFRVSVVKRRTGVVEFHYSGFDPNNHDLISFDTDRLHLSTPGGKVLFITEACCAQPLPEGGSFVAPPCWTR